jgi:hypothetical protein
MDEISSGHIVKGMDDVTDPEAEGSHSPIHTNHFQKNPYQGPADRNG